MKKILIILSGPAYGANETFNAVRLAVALSRRNDSTLDRRPPGRKGGAKYDYPAGRPE